MEDYGGGSEEGEHETVPIKVAAVSKKTHGIKDSKETWFNMAEGLAEADKKKLIEQVDKISSGDEIKLRCKPHSTDYSDVEITKKGEEHRDDYIGFDEVLNKAHKKFKDKLSIETEILITPEGKSVMTREGEKGWMVRAQVTIEGAKGNKQIFNGYGDATMDNTTDSIQKALPRMAETRAIARALRFAMGESLVAEELPGGDSTPQTSAEGQEGAPSKPAAKSGDKLKDAPTAEKGQKSLVTEALEKSETKKCEICEEPMKKIFESTKTGMVEVWKCKKCGERIPVKI